MSGKQHARVLIQIVVIHAPQFLQLPVTGLVFWYQEEMIATLLINTCHHHAIRHLSNDSGEYRLPPGHRHSQDTVMKAQAKVEVASELWDLLRVLLASEQHGPTWGDPIGSGLSAD